MKWDPLHKALAAGIGVLLIAGGIFLSSLIQAREDRARAEATAQAQKEFIDKSRQNVAAMQKQLADLQGAVAQRDQANAQALTAMQQAVAKLSTPQDMTAYITAALKLQQPVQFVTPPATKENPNPDTIATIPAASLQAITAQIEQCKESMASLTTCQADKADLTKQLGLKDSQLSSQKDQLAAIQKEADAWRTAAKGGSIWTRAKRDAKWLAIGVGAGAAIGYASGHH